jgi:hypothetical protein
MAKCALHPGRDSAAVIFGTNYCKACEDGIDAARALVDKHVVPKECFIWYKSNDNWQPIGGTGGRPGTGCAHWVAHQLGVHAGSKDDKCLQGFTYRVKVLVGSRSKIADISKVKPKDIWASPTLDHTGLVLRVEPPPKPGGQPKIIIRHDSSRQGRVADNEFATFFKGAGSFYH